MNCKSLGHTTNKFTYGFKCQNHWICSFTHTLI